MDQTNILKYYWQQIQFPPINCINDHMITKSSSKKAIAIISIRASTHNIGLKIPLSEVGVETYFLQITTMAATTATKIITPPTAPPMTAASTPPAENNCRLLLAH